MNRVKKYLSNVRVKTKLYLNMRNKRVELNLTKVKISQLIGISPSRYRSYEDGICDPPLHILVKILDVLQVQDAYLFITKELN